jgi:hypothetical protein
MQTSPLEKVHFYVTQKDLKKGIKYNCDKCPVARSIKRRLKHRNIIYIAVTPSFVTFICSDSTVVTNPLPEKVRDFIINFDNMGKHSVKSFRFYLEFDESFVAELK